MTVIIVAPSIPDLPLVAEEAAALANALPRRVLLQGEEATARGIINAIVDIQGSGRTVAGFWFASHGSDAGVVLTHGVLDAISLASLLSTAGARWCVLNTCGSRALVSAIQLRAAVDVVATEAEAIADASAWEFGRLLAIEYARTNNLEDSCAQVARGSDRHRYYRNNQRGFMAASEARTQDDKLDLLLRIIQGDSAAGHKGLRQIVEETNQTVGVLVDTQRVQRFEIDDLHRQQIADKASVESKFAAILSWVRVLAVVCGLTVLSLIAIFVIIL